MRINGGATSVAAGVDVTVGWSYSAGDWAFNSVSLRINDTVLCTERLSSTTDSGACSWATNGLVPGSYRVAAVVFDRDLDSFVGEECRAQLASTTVDVLGSPPSVARGPQDAIVTEGGSASFDTVARGSGPFSYAWQRSSDNGATFTDIPASSQPELSIGPVALADDGALFRVTVSNGEGQATSEAARLTVTVDDSANSCPDIAVPPLNSLNLKEGPRPDAGPQVPDDPAAWTGANYLADASFENELVYAGGIPTGTGYWAFDQAWSAAAGQQGIVPNDGGRMLHFVSSSAFGQAPAATASEQIQLVDVSALRDRIDAGEVEVEGSAFFNRVAAGGCVNIDSGFAIRIRAYDGLPQDFPARIGSPPLAPAAVGGVTVDDDPLTWQQGSAVLPLPAGTTYIAVQIDINERVNDMAYPEFHGHYVDDVRLSVRLRP